MCNIKDTTKDYYCVDNELCVNGHCECKPGYIRLNNECIKNNSNNPESTIQPDPPDVKKIEYNNNSAVVFVIPILLIIVLVIFSVFLIKRYNLVTWITNKINQRNAPYDEVMIGQEDDDPPLVGA